MRSEDIFEKSVRIMKQLFGSQEIAGSIERAKDRGQEGNEDLLRKERENVNGLVRQIAEKGGSGELLVGKTRQELVDAVVLRYLRNREIFIKTFPEGIDDIDPDPLFIWASIMISPDDERLG